MDGADLQQAVQEDLQSEPRADAACAAPSGGFLRIVAGYDGSAPASRALDAAVRLLQGPARLHRRRVGGSPVQCRQVVGRRRGRDGSRIRRAGAGTSRLGGRAVARPRGGLGVRAAPGGRRGGVGRCGGRHPRCPARPGRGDRDRELAACHSPHGRFGRRQPGPPCTGSPRDRALGSRCGEPRPGPGIGRIGP